MKKPKPQDLPSKSQLLRVLKKIKALKEMKFETKPTNK